LTPSKLSKINTGLQISLVLYLIGSQIYIAPNQFTIIFFIVVATTTVLSGIDYIWIWVEKVLSKEARK